MGWLLYLVFLAIFGLIVGAFARLALPGKDPLSLFQTMLLGLATYHEQPEGPEWVERFRTTKIEEQLVPTYLEQLAGGGSREGTGYGTAMMNLFHLQDLWEQTTGQDIAGLTPHTRESIAYTLSCAVATYTTSCTPWKLPDVMFTSATYSGCAYTYPSTGVECCLPNDATFTFCGVSSVSLRFWPVLA